MKPRDKAIAVRQQDPECGEAGLHELLGDAGREEVAVRQAPADRVVAEHNIHKRKEEPIRPGVNVFSVDQACNEPIWGLRSLLNTVVEAACKACKQTPEDSHPAHVARLASAGRPRPNGRVSHLGQPWEPWCPAVSGERHDFTGLQLAES